VFGADDDEDTSPSTPSTDSALYQKGAQTSQQKKANTPFTLFPDHDMSALAIQDNSFESKKGDAWGAKANEILSKVHGKNFKHEKTKKKRGSYAGGYVDQSSNSVKFNYDD